MQQSNALLETRRFDINILVLNGGGGVQPLGERKVVVTVSTADTAPRLRAGRYADLQRIIDEAIHAHDSITVITTPVVTTDTALPDDLYGDDGDDGYDF